MCVAHTTAVTLDVNNAAIEGDFIKMEQSSFTNDNMTDVRSSNINGAMFLLTDSELYMLSVTIFNSHMGNNMFELNNVLDTENNTVSLVVCYLILIIVY